MRTARNVILPMLVAMFASTTAFTQSTGDYQSAQSGNWNTAATWARWDGAQWITPAPSSPSIADGPVAILNGHIVTVSADDSVDQLTVTSGGKLILADTASFKIKNGSGDDLTVFDSLIVYGMLSVSDSVAIRFGDGGIFVHDRDGGSVPVATWETGSTCEIRGTITNPPSNLNQDFYNYVWDCPGQLGNQDWSWGFNTIHGTITVRSSGRFDRVRMTSPGASPEGPNVITLMGDIVVEGGSFESNGSSSPDTITINHYGNIISTSNGVFGVSRGSGPMVMWNVYGDISMTNTEVRNSGGPKANYYFKKQGDQVLTFTDVVFGGGGFPMIIEHGSILHVGSIEFTGWTTFAVDSGGTFATTHPRGLDGNLQMGNTRTLHPDAGYMFEGSDAQATGSILPPDMGRLTINNAAGVALNHRINPDTLALISGVFDAGDDTVTVQGILGGSSDAFVRTSGGGALTRHGDNGTETFFPVGTDAFSPVWITNSGTADDYTVSVAPDDETDWRFGRVRNRWTINEAAPGGTEATLRLGWMASLENDRFAENRAADSRILRVGNDTTEAGRGGYRRQLSTEPYTVERDSIASFSSFVVGAIGPFTLVGSAGNNLPIEFAVDRNYPNPFNPSTAIRYHIPNTSLVTVKVHDILGRVVAELVNKDHEPGSYTVQWNAGGFSSGMYYCTVTMGEEMKLLKLVLLK